MGFAYLLQFLELPLKVRHAPKHLMWLGGEPLLHTALNGLLGHKTAGALGAEPTAPYAVSR